ncbi:MAG: porin [Candidatus Protistobacter heckmanni]|nr:porin [Candidatus Protistobacter heckmanni]
MKKSLLAIGALAALYVSSAIAQSIITVYGLMDAGFRSTKGIGSSGTTFKFNGGTMTTSYFGIKGTEDMGGSNKAFFDLASLLNSGTGATIGGSASSNLFGRSAVVGLSSTSLGTLSFGHDINPSFLPTILFNAYGDSGGWSPLWHATYFNFTQFSSFTTVDSLVNDTAWDNQVKYSSPSLGSATVSLHYAPGGVAGDSSVANYGGNVLYFNGPLALTAYYQQTKINSPGSSQTNIYAAGTVNGVTITANQPTNTWMVGGSYDFSVVKAFATYQDSKQSASGLEAKVWSVSAQIPAGPGKVLAEYAGTKLTAATSKTLTEWLVGYDYPLSKRTDVYANYLYSKDNTVSSTGYTAGVGLRHRF